MSQLMVQKTPSRHGNESFTIGSLHLYPIKSCAAVDVKSAFVAARGLSIGSVHDRSWVLTDLENMRLSQREYPLLATVKIEPFAREGRAIDSLRVSARDLPALTLDLSCVSEEIQRIRFPSQTVGGHLASEYVNDWFSSLLGVTTKAFYQTPGDVRLCNPNFVQSQGENAVGYADGYPYLLTTDATLNLLDARLAGPTQMTRFRPNIVVTNTRGEQEYGWRDVSAGSATFCIVKPCSRCVVTTIDQLTGERSDREPLRELARSAFLNQKFAAGRVQGAIFGEYAVAAQCGMISVGDALIVRSIKTPYAFRPSARLKSPG